MKNINPILGAIIGDIIGSRFEFNNCKHSQFKMFDESCDFTDDTICTLAIADAIIRTNSVPNYRKSLKYWCRKYPNPMGGYGNRFHDWVFSDAQEPYNSFGNGSAMRVSACGSLAHSKQHAINLARLSAKVTHNHPDGILGAEFIAELIYTLQHTEATGFNLINITNRYYSTQIEYPIPQSNPFDETCTNTVLIAINCLAHSISFEDAIRKAVLVGGDTDTIAAITGSLAGALYVIPPKFINFAKLYLDDNQLDLIKTLEKYAK